MSELGSLLWERGDLTGADALLRQCLTITRQVLPDDHPDLSSSIHNVALVTQARGDHAAAEAMFRQSLAIDRKAVGAHHATNAFTLNNLSHALREQGKHGEAAAALEEAMTITRSTRGDEHPVMAMLLVNRARVHLARGEANAATPLLTRALAIRSRVFPEDDWRVAVTKSVLGQSLTSLARYQEAETLLIAHRVLKDMGAKQDQAQANINRLVALYEAWGRPKRRRSIGRARAPEPRPRCAASECIRFPTRRCAAPSVNKLIRLAASDEYFFDEPALIDVYVANRLHFLVNQNLVGDRSFLE